MVSLLPRLGQARFGILAGVLAASAIAWPLGLDARQANKADVLSIGTSGSLTPGKKGAKEDAGLATLHSFIKDETGFENQITREKDWRDLADKMSKGELKIGVFQGPEFAWASAEHPGLKPLVLAVNVTRYPVAYIITRRDDAAKDFVGLQGQSFCLPDNAELLLRLFAEKECKTKGKDLQSYFSKITTQQVVEDALDDVVDGIVQATVADRAALEAYKRNKQGRFAKLKEVDKSIPFPPVVIAYYAKMLDDATMRQFRDRLLGVARKEKGRALLDSFKLTGFDAVPDDFEKVLEETRKTYPPPKAAK